MQFHAKYHTLTEYFADLEERDDKANRSSSTTDGVKKSLHPIAVIGGQFPLGEMKRGVDDALRSDVRSSRSAVACKLHLSLPTKSPPNALVFSFRHDKRPSKSSLTSLLRDPVCMNPRNLSDFVVPENFDAGLIGQRKRQVVLA